MFKASMKDITLKEEVYREARAYGIIKLKPETVELIRKGDVSKGDVEAVASTAAIMAVKRAWEQIPLCHPIRITGVKVEFTYGRDHVRVDVTVRATERTGVEMEALVGVTTALLTIWDMVKEYEKDDKGNYPDTVISEVRVSYKIKGSP